ncbi:MAG: hypothetical protein WA739_21805, partial [Candidatus Acidiferrales bacterium]
AILPSAHTRYSNPTLATIWYRSQKLDKPYRHFEYTLSTKYSHWGRSFVRSANRMDLAGFIARSGVLARLRFFG